MASPSLLLGFVIGGTKCAAVVGYDDGRIVACVEGSTARTNTDDILANLDVLAKDALGQSGVSVGEVSAIGVSFGGSWDSRAELTRTPPNMPQFGVVPLRQILGDKYGVPVGVENDANATALAEFWWGAGRGCSSIVFSTWGTGIGAGLILGGKLYRGRNDNAGEYGHTTLDPNGPPCQCGRRGCLEAFASGSSIGRIATARYGEPVEGVEVSRRARAGDPIAKAIVDEAAAWMGIAIANLLQTLNVERVILGSIAVNAGDLFLDPVRASAKKHCWPDIWEGVEIVAAGLGESSQWAAALAVAVTRSGL